MVKTVAAQWPVCSMEVEYLAAYDQIAEIADHFRSNPYKYVWHHSLDYYEYDEERARFVIVETFCVEGKTYERRERSFGVGSYLITAPNGYRIFTMIPGVEQGLFMHLPAVMFLA